MAIERLPLADEIGKRLRDQILGGQLAPGERLTEQGVARLMGTSPGPVREAFSALAREGLIISLPHRGTFVSEVSEDEAKIAYDVREVLEPHVAELAMARLTPHGIDQLTDRISEMRNAARRKDFTALMAADMRFHGFLYELAGGKLLASVWAPIQLTIRKFAVIAAPHYYRDRDVKDTVGDHELLLKLLQEGDGQTLRREYSRHLHDLWSRIQEAASDHSGAEDSRKLGRAR